MLQARLKETIGIFCVVETHGNGNFSDMIYVYIYIICHIQVQTILGAIKGCVCPKRALTCFYSTFFLN